MCSKGRLEVLVWGSAGKRGPIGSWSPIGPPEPGLGGFLRESHFFFGMKSIPPSRSKNNSGPGPSLVFSAPQGKKLRAPSQHSGEGGRERNLPGKRTVLGRTRRGSRGIPFGKKGLKKDSRIPYSERTLERVRQNWRILKFFPHIECGLRLGGYPLS